MNAATQTTRHNMQAKQQKHTNAATLPTRCGSSATREKCEHNNNNNNNTTRRRRRRNRASTAKCRTLSRKQPEECVRMYDMNKKKKKCFCTQPLERFLSLLVCHRCVPSAAGPAWMRLVQVSSVWADFHSTVARAIDSAGSSPPSGVPASCPKWSGM